ncbi:Rieske 2Fe-2S domain-containing protein [Ornithinimicrobium sp. W1679]|uniref:Rieske 2Fe-2S domain-containing protein n=1 Tax=unclassified Ornithinimicrobium TaxID=2615080 RepID=UPI003CEB7DDE
MFLTPLMKRLEETEGLDAAVDSARSTVNTVLPQGPVKDVLHGKPLGHALHPLLVALPIGLNVGASLLDVLGDEGDQAAARRLVGAALVSTVPTVATGWADWSELGSAQRPARVGLVHAVANGAAAGVFAASWFARLAGHHRAGAALSMVGLAGLGAAGYLGGHLVYAQGVAVSRTMDHEPAPADWTDVAAAEDVGEGLLRVEAAGQPVVLTRAGGGLAALAATCTHLGGPLDEGTVEDGCVVCPWHGSRFDLRDGAVERGPASVPQPAYDVRETDGRVQVRARP